MYEDETDLEPTEDTEGEDEPPFSQHWLEPHYFMRPHMYTNPSSARGYPTFPQRQNVLEQSYSVIYLKGEGHELPGDLRGKRVRLDLGKDSKWHADDLSVLLSPVVLPMKDTKGREYNCHVPESASMSSQKKGLDEEEINELIQKADRLLAEDLNPCWKGPTDAGFDIEFCWNQSMSAFVTADGVRTKRSLGNMMNRSHHFQMVPDGSFIDPLALSTTYEEGDLCNVTDVIADKERRWKTSIWLHCTQHGTDHLERDRWGGNPKASPWSYEKDSKTCTFRIDLWSNAVCAATLPLLHRNRNYIICRPHEEEVQ